MGFIKQNPDTLDSVSKSCSTRRIEAPSSLKAHQDSSGGIRRSKAKLAARIIVLFIFFAHQPLWVSAQSTIPPPATTYLTAWSPAINPNDIAANPKDGTLAVVDAGNDSIEILRPGGSHKTFRRGFKDPRSAAFLPGGILLVGEAKNGSVKGFNEQGSQVLTLGAPNDEFDAPNDIAVHPVTGLIYVVDSSANQIKVYRPSDGEFVFQFGAAGIGPGELDYPISIAINPTRKEAYIGDSRNRRIAVFNSETGEFLRNIGQAGSQEEDISFVGGLHVDSENRIYVVESLGGYVLMLDPFGNFVGKIGEHGNALGQLRSPKAVAIDRYNRLLVTSFINKKIEVWGLDQFENPVDLDLVVTARAIPDHINTGLPSFKVTIELENEDVSDINPNSLLVNGVVRPIPESWQFLLYFLTIRFPTAEVIYALSPMNSDEVFLELTGETYDGLWFSSEIPIIIVPGDSIPDVEGGI